MTKKDEKLPRWQRVNLKYQTLFGFLKVGATF